MSRFVFDADTGLMVPGRAIERVRGRPLCMGAPQQALLSYGAATETDPYFSDVIFLYNNSLTAVDTSTVGRTLTAAGGAAISTADPFVSGGGAMLLDGTGDYYTSADSADLDFVGSFTIDAVLKPANITTTMYVMAHYNSASTGRGWYMYMDATGHIVAETRTAYNSTGVITSSSVLSTSAYTHVQWNYLSGGACYLFFNGSQVGTSTSTANPGSNAELLIIGDFGGNSLNGQIAALRITQNVRRNTANFAALTGAFPTS